MADEVFRPGDLVWYYPVLEGPGFAAVVNGHPWMLCGTEVVMVVGLGGEYREYTGKTQGSTGNVATSHLRPRAAGYEDVIHRERWVREPNRLPGMGVGCRRHPESESLATCPCPKGWLENRALWVAAERRALAAEAERDTMRHELEAAHRSWQADVARLTGERDAARDAAAKAMGDRCTVCDEDGLIYVPVHGGEDADEEPQACPMCDGTRSGYASAITKERDTLASRLVEMERERDEAMRVVAAARVWNEVARLAYPGDFSAAESRRALRGAVTAWESQQKGESE
jgi:hypothetical protein